MAQYSFLRFLVLCYSLLLPVVAENEETNQRKCPTSFPCGQFGQLRFPFTNTSSPGCGLPVSGCDVQTDIVKVQSSKTWYRLNSMGWNNSIFVTDHSLQKLLNSRTCNAFTYDLYDRLPLSSPMLQLQVQLEHQISLLTCKYPLDNATKYMNHIYCKGSYIYYPSQYFSYINMSEKACSTIILPTKSSTPVDNSTDMYTLVIPKFQIQILLSEDCRKCQENGNQCQVYNSNCASTTGAADPHHRTDKILKAGLVAMGSVSVIILCLTIVLFHKRRNNRWDKYNKHSHKVHCSHISNPISKQKQSQKVHCSHISKSGSNLFGIPILSYKELEEATSNFDEARELGSGGFGVVYYGKLSDGREVAVKRLYEYHNRQIKEFMNEIEILTRLRHKNLVSLYGCTSQHTKELLLVYEYIPNGTVASHLHGDFAKTGFLPWPKRMKIAIETASALSYLHASGIIHRDVKTNNILLDDNFCVKVADFGFSRLLPNNVTHVSTAPQGTRGYMDPAYHQFYKLTNKSDVYSFGVVLVELVSSLKAVDITRDNDEINLSNLAIKKIKNGTFSELIDPSLGFQLDKEIQRKTFSVAKLAFQCLQDDKDLRPSMVQVLEALKRIEGGEDESLSLI